MGGAQLVESRCARSGLGRDIHFELLLRGESGGGFYFLIQDCKGEKVAGETAWTGMGTSWQARTRRTKPFGKGPGCRYI